MDTNNKNYIMKQRLESLDVLRGLDLFVLVFFQPVFIRLAQVQPEGHFLRAIQENVFTHVEWEGFHLWDQIMPLFLFMAGTSIPYAFAGYKSVPVLPKSVYYRVGKRVLLLWILGGIVQGNFLALNIDTLYIYTDTLQAIACGYLFSVLLYMTVSVKKMLAFTLLLPAVYTLLMLSGGSYLPGDNMAEQIDRMILGRFIYGTSVSDSGKIIYADWYHISWLLSSLNFVATVMSGVLVGVVLKADMKQKKKMLILLAGGVACLLVAYCLSFFEPVIKRLWTSSMTFLSSGISIILMLFFYYLIDIRKQGKYLKWLKIYGMNSILAYMIYNTMNSKLLLQQWLYGLEQFVGRYYSFVLELAFVSLLFLFLRYCYRMKFFLKV